MIKYHSFIDGNNRTATVTTAMFLSDDDVRWEYTDDEIVEFVLKIASSDMKLTEIIRWIREKSEKDV